jgi:3-oxoacyl-[acyl-carrier-protein] synthase-3
VHLPDGVLSSAEVEARVRAASPACQVRDGLVEALTGVRQRRLAPPEANCSDLAVAAARSALAHAAVEPADVDGLIFAAAGQDLLEPSTATIVADKLGTTCPAFDLKNACNSFLDAIGVAEAMIASGTHRNVLVAAGELPTRAIRWDAPSVHDLRLNFPGYTLGDAGAAVLVEGAGRPGGAILHRAALTVPRHWSLATVAGGGSMHPRGDEWTYLRGDGAGLREAFTEVGPGIVRGVLEACGLRADDLARVLVHQVTLPFLDAFLAATGLPADRVERTLPLLGNMAAASLPVAYAQALDGGLVPGDRVLWVGLAGGISIHVLVTEV